MFDLKKDLSSTILQKFLMGLTGVALLAFIVVHLLGNLTLYMGEGTYFNAYVFKLKSMGKLLYVAEVGLLLLFGLHIITAIRLKLRNLKARSEGYFAATPTKGGQATSNFASRNMVISGLILLAFLIFHLYQFRFGPTMEDGYVTTVDGQQSIDLYRLVVESFSNGWVVALYTVCMLVLGLHLRHGFWSAWQSLGLMNAKYTKCLYGVALLFAIVVAMGFLFIPLWIYYGQHAAL